MANSFLNLSTYSIGSIFWVYAVALLALKCKIGMLLLEQKHPDIKN